MSSYAFGMLMGLLVGAPIGLVVAGLLHAASREPEPPTLLPRWVITLAPRMQGLPEGSFVTVDCVSCLDGVRWSEKEDGWVHTGGPTPLTCQLSTPAPLLQVRRRWSK